MSETLPFPTLIDPAELDRAQQGMPLMQSPMKQGVVGVPHSAPDLTKIDLTDVALAMYGKWPEEVAAVKSNLSTLALDLSTPSKITEARSLRKRLILDPLATARKVASGIKSKMAQTSKAVGAELEKIEKAYQEADALILPKIEAREAELAAEKLERERKEAERQAKHQEAIARFRAYAVKAETAPDMTAARVATAIAQMEALPAPTKETFEEFAVEAANAICETLEKLRIIHARLLRAEQAEAEAAELRAKLAAQAPTAAVEAPRISDAIGVEAPRIADNIGTEYTEGQAPQQVLKAEPATADATDRDAPADASPRVGAMGVGQPADAGPAGGRISAAVIERGAAALDAAAASVVEPVYVDPADNSVHRFTDIQPVEPADDATELLREALALTKYAAAPFMGKFPSHPKTTPEWWAGLREQIEALQPRLIKHLEAQV